MANYQGGVSGEGLEHYGRIGMKWYQHIYGEADGRAKYVARYKEKEGAKLKKRKANLDKLETEATEDVKWRYDNTRKDTPERAKKAKEKYDANVKYWKNQAKMGRDVVNAEMKRIEEYTIDDIMKEAKFVKQSVAAVIAANLVNIPAAMLGSPIAVFQFGNSAEEMRTNYRLNSQEWEKQKQERKDKKNKR